MRITEQIDALESMAVNPIQYLVLPRIIAAMIVDADPDAAVLRHRHGRRVLRRRRSSSTSIRASGSRTCATSSSPIDVVQGLIKSVFFGFMVALVGCYQGFNATGGGRGVGIGTTRAVVIASVTTLVMRLLPDRHPAVRARDRQGSLEVSWRCREVALRRRSRRDPVPAARDRRLHGVEEPRPEPGGQEHAGAVRAVPRRVGLAEGQQGRGRRPAEGRGHRPRGRGPLREGHVQAQQRHPGVDERGRDQEGDVAARRELPRDRSGRAGAAGARRHEARRSRGSARRARTTTADDDAKRDACRQIPNVVEATTPDQLLHRIEQTLPNVDRVLESVRDLSEDVRRIVNGPLRRSRTASTASSRSEADTVAGHHRARRSLDGRRSSRSRTTCATITQGRRSADQEDARRTSTTRRPMRRISSRPRRTSSSRPATSCAASSTSSTASSTTRSSITEKIDEDKGTLGRLVNDPAIADNVEQITDDAQGLPRHAVRAQGLRRAAQRVQLRRRPGAQLHHGRAPHAARQVLPDRAREGPARRLPGRHADVRSDASIRTTGSARAVISDSIRFTFQFAKRFAG